MMSTILSLAIKYEHDVVAARQRARQIAWLLGFESQDQTRIATAVSEIARNAFTYAGGGRVEFAVEGRTAPQLFTVNIIDHGPGIAELPRILGGQYTSPTGMGIGILGARRLMDNFVITSGPGKGTVVTLTKILPRDIPAVTQERMNELVAALARQRPRTPIEEIQQQNQELLRALEELRSREEELRRLNGELEDTNRGVVALYAELDEKADHLRRADEMKTRFLSNMSHEFRTPLNSIQALTRLLLERSDGDLTPEQVRQVEFIRKASHDLTELVNDLLDLAKVEAGKIVVRPTEFEAANLFGALRGMLRPLLVNESVALIFDDTSGVPPLLQDEAKVSQILRNFISNALKFTERGEVRVSAALVDDGEAVAFSVADTGIGIAPEDQERIFQQFGQLENPLQRKVRGTGLGLPLTKKLVEILGGRITLASELGTGATFTAILPVRFAQAAAEPVAANPAQPDIDPTRLPVLVVEDSPEELAVYEILLRGSRYQVLHAATVRQAREMLRRIAPRAIVLDILLRGEDTWAFLAELKASDRTRDVPVVVASMVDDRHKGFGLGADAYVVKPVERGWLMTTLDSLTAAQRGRPVLIIDDDETSRYVVRQLLNGTRYETIEAASGAEGLERAREQRPAAIFLDLVMPGLSGFEVLDALRSDERTRGIPVVILTSKALEPDDHRRLDGKVTAVLSKSSSSREVACAALDFATSHTRS
ncbi:MAG: histidine kinase [Candidatus Rokubacteria bacterium 13_1_40CM_68_15]|nr:MAG: histidine kinase [Candidatus Rokubacteria bacterium 13_1_40CM_68_15]